MLWHTQSNMQQAQEDKVAYEKIGQGAGERRGHVMSNDKVLEVNELLRLPKFTGQPSQNTGGIKYNATAQRPCTSREHNVHSDAKQSA